jgi:hypothetical protein
MSTTSKEGSSTLEMDYHNAVQVFFDFNLKPGMTFSSKEGPFTTPPPNSALVYQDSTSCSGYYAFSDVFLIETKDTKEKLYLVQTEMGGGREEPWKEFINKECKSLEEVLVVLAGIKCLDPTSTASMCYFLITGAEKFFQKGEGHLVLEKIKQDPLLIKKMHIASQNGEFRYNQD